MFYTIQKRVARLLGSAILTAHVQHTITLSSYETMLGQQRGE